MRRLNWFGFWTLLGLVSGVQLFFADQRLALHPNAWWQALATTLPALYLWGLLSLGLAALAELERRLTARPVTERLLVEADGRSFFVRVSDVEWVEAAKNYVRLHVGATTHVLRSTLGALEERLDPERFRRISRSTLVNLDRVREVQPWFHGDAVVILESGTRLGLSRRYRTNLLGTPVL